MGIRLWALILSISFLATSCSSPFSTSEDSSATSVTLEKSYCSTVVSVSSGVTITGTAEYYYRATALDSGQWVLTGNPVLGKIPYAEIIVTDSSGTTVQCGLTGAQGEISVNIPKKAGTYTLAVNSRSDSGKIKLSILKDITSNDYYSITKTFNLAGTESSYAAGSLTAYARIPEDPEMKGGAFHIMRDIYKANEYIRNTIADTNFVAPKVTVYWKAGFNPNSYRDPSYANNGLSFYSSGNRKLYILGGISGAVKNVDTDHFDDSVVIHEYGHFLEDIYAKSDSPGGSHNGNGIIDPRLAWSEGWANFLQSAVLTNWDDSTNGYSANVNTNRGKYYIDTIGFRNDTVETGEAASQAVLFNLSQDGATAGLDAVSVTGEGTFREVSISRTLYKAISSSGVLTLGGDLPFPAIWTAFSSSVQGLAASSAVFRNVGLFNLYLTNIITNNYAGNLTKWNNIVADEQQNKNTADYGNPLVAQSGSCSLADKSILPVNDSSTCSTSAGTTSVSNKLRSNDFFTYYHDGNAATITLTYATAGGFGSVADLDLYVYKYDHTYFEDCYSQFGYSPSSYGVVVRSARRNPTFETGSESVSLSGLAAGYYLINVKAYSLNLATMTSKGSTYNLQVTTTSTRNLCPTY